MNPTLGLTIAGVSLAALCVALLKIFSFVFPSHPIVSCVVAALIPTLGWIWTARWWGDRLADVQRENARLQTEVDKLAELKDQFLSNVSHAFRSPLASIKGFADLLWRQKEGFTGKQLEYLSSVRESTERLRSFVDNVIDMSKLQANVMEYHPEPIDIQDIAEKVLSLCKDSYTACHIQASIDMPSRLCIYADSEHLQRIFLHLFANALNATPDGGRITIWAKDAGDMVTMGVSDTGIGISEDAQKDIFGKFKQAQIHNAQIRKSHGSGLGLAIVHQLVLSQKGRIWIEKSSPEGTVMAFSLPKPKSDTAKAPQMDQRAA